MFRPTATLLCAALLAATAVIAGAATAKKPALIKVPPTKVLPTKKRDLLRTKLKQAGGCNANVCFAIDGSTRMPNKEFLAQKNFALDLISIIAVDHPVELAAMQYGNEANSLSGLSVDVEKVILKLNDAKKVGGGSNTRSGIEFCATQLKKRGGEANKLVLLGDGFTNVGRNAVRRAHRFRWEQRGDLSVVAAGDSDYIDIFALSGFDHSRMFEVDNFFDVLAIEGIIKKLVSSICGVGGKKGFPWVPKQKFPHRVYNMKAREKRWAQYCKTHTCTWDD